MNILDEFTSKTDLVLKALACEAVEARCVACGVVEFVIPLDRPIGEEAAFLANYHCDGCEAID